MANLVSSIPRKRTSTVLRRSASDKVFHGLLMCICVIIIIVMVYPMYFVLVASISSPAAVINGRTWLLPADISLRGYGIVFENARIWVGYRNTIMYTFVGTFISVACTMMGAYALSRKTLPFRRFFQLYFVFTMFFSGGLVPTYFVISDLGMIDTFWVMVIPFAVSVFNLVIARTFIDANIPEELFEAAKMDGCDHFRFFWQILLPLSKAILAVLALFYAVGYWNDFFRALIYLQSDSRVPLQLVLREILIQNQQLAGMTGGFMEQVQLAEQLKYVLIIVSTLPLLVAYPFIQKHFTKGVMIGSLKG